MTKLLRAPSFVAATILVALAGPSAVAQDWPTRPLTLVIPFGAGGGIDASARIQAQHMSELLKQPIVAENIGAAGGMAGSLRSHKSVAMTQASLPVSRSKRSGRLSC